MRTLLSKTELQAGVAQLAAQLNCEYESRPLTIIAIMTGSLVFLADLIRLLRMPLRVGVVQASSYRGEMVRGKLTINAEMMPDIAQHDVLLIDDIFDTGNTLAEVVRLMHALGPTSLRTAVLLRKQGRQLVAMLPDHTLFEIPDEFVVGYGLDYQDKHRNLPYIAVMEPSDLTLS